VIATVDLDQLTHTGSPVARLMDPTDATSASHPEFRIDHPFAQGLNRDDNTVMLPKLLRGERGTKIVIAGSDQV
jgi:hypothetical protein